jgi:Endomembrane protein 70
VRRGVGEERGDSPPRDGTSTCATAAASRHYVHYVPLVGYAALLLLCLVGLGIAAARNWRRTVASSAVVGKDFSGVGGTYHHQPTGPSRGRNLDDDDDDDEEEEGGDSLGGGVAGRLGLPVHPALYCAVLGSGIQVYVAVLLFLSLSAAGIIRQVRPGPFLVAPLLMFAFRGILAGAVCGRFSRSLGLRPTQHRRCAIYTALAFPGGSLGMFCVCSVALGASGSVAPALRVRLKVQALGAALWLFVHVPLVFAGMMWGSGIRSPRQGSVLLLPDLSRIARTSMLVYLPLHMQQIRCPTTARSSAPQILVLAGCILLFTHWIAVIVAPVGALLWRAFRTGRSWDRPGLAVAGAGLVLLVILLEPYPAATMVAATGGAFFAGRHYERRSSDPERLRLPETLREASAPRTQAEHEDLASDQDDEVSSPDRKPRTTLLLDDALCVLVAGILPFQALHVELFFPAALAVDGPVRCLSRAAAVRFCAGVRHVRHVCRPFGRAGSCGGSENGTGRRWGGSGGGIALYVLVYSAGWFRRLDAAPVAAP